MDRAVFANPVAVSDVHRAANLRAESEILRFSANHRSITNDIPAPHDHAPGDHRVRLNFAPISDLRLPLDHGIWAHDHVRANGRLRVYKRGRMNHPANLVNMSQGHQECDFAAERDLGVVRESLLPES